MRIRQSQPLSCFYIDVRARQSPAGNCIKRQELVRAVLPLGVRPVREAKPPLKRQDGSDPDRVLLRHQAKSKHRLAVEVSTLLLLRTDRSHGRSAVSSDPEKHRSTPSRRP